MILNWVDDIFYALSWDYDLTSWQFSDSTNSKRNDIWIRLSLSNDLWSYEEMNDWSLYSSSFWLE